MRKYIALPVVSLLALALVACSTPPNTNLEQAHSSLFALQSQPDATEVTTLEVKDAGDWPAKADKAYQDGKNRRDVDQLAYLINQRIELTKQTIALRNVEAQLQNVSAQHTQTHLDVHTAQLDKLHSQLNAKQTLRDTIMTFGDTLFDFDKSDLRPDAMRNTQQLAEFPQQNPEYQVIVESYTDSTGSVNYNQHLSERRVSSVRMALLSRGISPERVATRGYGKKCPVASSDTSSGHAMNCRVGVIISSDAKPVAPRSSVSGWQALRKPKVPPSDGAFSWAWPEFSRYQRTTGRPPSKRW